MKRNGLPGMLPGGTLASVKVLFNCCLPFSLAHGGQAIQILQTMNALQKIGVEVEPVRWWDPHQAGDLIHYHGRMAPDQIRFAHQKGMKVILGELLTGAGSQNLLQRKARRAFRWIAENMAPAAVAGAFQWESYRLADGFTVLTAWEKFLMEYKYDAPSSRIHVVSNGVEEVFFESPPVPRGKWLVCTATITERKRVLELAQAAVMAQTPVWIIGKAYSESSPYAREFFRLASANPQWIRFEGAVDDRAALAGVYRAARGFVLLSTMESQSLSALEAAACGCPLLLSQLPWAQSSFPAGVRFCPVSASTRDTAAFLKSFYQDAPQLPCPPAPPTWGKIAMEFQRVYETVLSTKADSGNP